MSRGGVMLALLLVAGCGKGEGIAVLSIDASPSLPSVARLHVHATVGARSADADDTTVGGRAIPPARTLGIVVPLGVGNVLSVKVTALDGKGVPLASAAGSVNVAAGKRADLHLTLTGTPLVDGGAIDLGGTDGGGSELADLAGADLSIADMAMPPDLTAVDLLGVPPRDLALVGQLSVTKAASPANVDLTAEGTVDWIQLGLNSASDVNRSSTGGSLITVNAAGALARYTTYVTKLAWTNGMPTASASNVTSGAYVTGAGDQFTISVPATTTARTLRLYLDIIGTATFNAHLSDGSAPDFNDTQSNASMTAEYEYTVRYASAANATLTITWRLQSGTAVSCVAATLQ